MNRQSWYLIAMLLITFACIPRLSGRMSVAKGQSPSNSTQMTNYTLTVEVFEWLGEAPVANLSFALTMNGTQITGITNSTGMFRYDWVGQRAQNVYATVTELMLEANYTAIRICNAVMDTAAVNPQDRSVSYSGHYSGNSTFYDNILVNLWTSVTQNRTFITCQMYVERGRGVKVSDYDPATQGKIQLVVNPGLPIYDVEPTAYEDWYFVPVGYPLTVVDVPDFTGASKYSTLAVTIGGNTSVINWTHHATVEFYTKRLNAIEQRLVWYDSQGFPLEDERRDYLQTVAIYTQASDLIGRGNYSTGMDYLSQAQERSSYVSTELDNVDNYVKMTVLLVTLFSYGFARLMPTLFMNDERKRLIASVAIYFGLIAVFTLTQPHIKVALAMAMGALTGYTGSVVNMDLIMTLTAAFLWSTFVFLLMFAISSLRTLSFAGFIMDVAMRNMKARRNRTLLTMATVALIVGSSVAFVNIASSRGIVQTGSWQGTAQKSLIIEPQSADFPAIETYQVLWLKDQTWAKEVSYEMPFSGDLLLGRMSFTVSVEILRGQISVAQAFSGKTIDMAFYQEHYNLSQYLIGSLPMANERGILLPSTMVNVAVGQAVELKLHLFSTLSNRPVEITVSLGTFVVKGLFEPTALSKLTRLDGQPLLGDVNELVLAPNGILPANLSQIREVTVVTTDDADVQGLAKELAFMFSLAATANSNGQAARYQEVFTFTVAGGWAQLIPLVIAGLLTYNIVGATVLERKRDISTMAVLGASPTNVTQIFIAEVVVLGFISTLIGFFGSYFLNSLVSAGAVLLNLLGVKVASGGLAAGQWSLSAIIVALFSGVVVTALAGLIPTLRVQNISLMERSKRRVIPLEASRMGLLNEYVLPLRVPSLDGELLFSFLKEVFGERMRDIEAKYDLYQDGTFQVGFRVKGWASNDVSAFVDMTIRVERRAESLYMVLVFPDVLRDSKPFQEFLYKLERNLISYTTWREARVRIKIVRGAVTAPTVRTLEDIIGDLRALQGQIDEVGGKLEKLEAMRTKITATVYTEFENRYKGDMAKLIKRLRPLGMELEPYRDNLRKEIRDLSTKSEKLQASYNLGEIPKEEYESQIEPIESRLKVLRANSDRIEELYKQLRTRVTP
jgi:hypothetical protein